VPHPQGKSPDTVCPAKAGRDNASMSKQTASNLFMFSPFASKLAGFYQDLLKGVLSYPQLGNRLIRLAEQAHSFRQFDKIKELGLMLSNFPIKDYQAIGTYYLAVAANSKGNGDQDEAKRLFELVVSTAPDAYKVKSIISLGALSFHRRDFESALSYYYETIKAGRLSAASLHAIKAIGVIKAMEGTHPQAVKDLESILPVIRYAPAHICFDILNSYAVELGEVGRKDEARNIMRVVLASPFADAYPEWRETAEELKPSRRSMVAISSFPYNVLAMPAREPNEQPELQPKPARVLNFAKWKKKMAKKDKDKQIEKSLDEMSFKDLGFKLLELITTNQADEDQMRTILAGYVFSSGNPVPTPDLISTPICLPSCSKIIHWFASVREGTLKPRSMSSF
jgi:tetratricopeptide (TPR) repeat protein